MRGGGDLGFSGAAALVAAVFLLGPVMVLVVRRRWALAAARSEEVARLVQLAAEEAERAEWEAAALAYALPPVEAGVMVEVAPRPQCAVCFSPTTTRCSRCKAVRYCSGKCQIIHWRKGHKDECYAPIIIDDYGKGNVPDFTTEKSDSLTDSPDTEVKIHVKPAGTVSERPSPESNSSKAFSVEANLDAKAPLGSSAVRMSSDVLNVPSPSKVSMSAMPVVDDASVTDGPSLLQNAKVGAPLSCDDIPDKQRGSTDGCETKSKFPPAEVAGSGTSVNDRPSYDSFVPKASRFKAEEVECSPGASPRSAFISSDNCKNAGTSDDTGEEHEKLSNSTVRQSSQADSPGSKSCPKGVSIQMDAGSCSQSSILPNQTKLFYRTTRSESSSHQAAPSECTTYLSLKDQRGPAASESRNDACKVRSKGSQSRSPADHASSNGERHSVSGVRSPKASTVQATPSISSGSASAAPNVGGDLTTSVRRVVQQFKSSKYLRHHSFETSSDISRKYKMLFPYDHFIKLYNCDKVELQPCGLTNCGNSCYANAVLQCLAFTRPLTAYFLQGLHTKTCATKDWCFTCEFEGLLMKAKQEKSPLSPTGILSHIQNIGSNLGHGREEDAHEFLRYAIDTMQSVCLKEAGTDVVGPCAEETTLIQLIFGGFLRSKIKCMRCHGKSERQERMMDLTVEIQGDIGTLEEALTRFTATEILDGENKYQCNRCKSYERAKKKLTVLEAPNVLTIALKRFQSGKFGKLNKAVRFPEYLNLAPYMSGTDDKSPVYRLYGVVVHLDVMNASFSGHYVCYVKTMQGKWFKIDDSVVKPVELGRVLSKTAYLLLYARCSPRAPSLLRNPASHDLKVKRSRNREVPRSGHGGESSVSSTSSSPMTLRPGSSVSRHIFEPSDFFNYRVPPRTDSSSDSSSLFSCSDESSCTTESTRDSTSTEEYSEYLFGDSGRFNWNSPLRFSEDSDGYTCSPLRSEADSNGHIDYTRGGDLPRNSSGKADNLSYEAEWAAQGSSREQRRPTAGSSEVSLEGKEGPPFLYSDTTNQCRKVEDQDRSRETDLVNQSVGKSSVLFRRSSTRDRTAQIFY